jgi:hypothetical protein
MAVLKVADVGADERTAPQLLPSRTVVYFELPNPKALISTIFDHPLREKVEALQPYQQAIQSQPYRNFLTGRKFVEIQLGMEWREALETLTAKGISVAVDGETQGLAVLVRGQDVESMSLLRDKLLVLTTLGQNADRLKEAEYRGIKVFGNNKARLAVYEDWLVATNHSDLGMGILDRLLDGEGKSLADDEDFWTASTLRQRGSTVWGFVDVKELRNAGIGQKALQGKTPNPAVELLVGGILSTLGNTPYGTVDLTVAQDELSVDVSVPHDPQWIPEEREFFFGPDSTGRAPVLPDVANRLFTLSTYRDFAEMWLRAGDLFDEKINDGFAQADANLTTFFAGKDFGEDILGSLTPQVGFVASRQDFTDILPQPAIKLPSFALVMELREPEEMTRELRRTFQSMIGFFNVLGAMEGRPQLEMEMDKLDDGSELITTVYIPEEDDRESTSADIIFNFSPSVGFSGKRFVVASTGQLARELTAAAVPERAATDSNTDVSLQGDILQQILNDNREQLIAQNMLGEGHSREEAEAAIGLLLEAVGYLKDASLQLVPTAESLRLGFSVRLEQQP